MITLDSINTWFKKPLNIKTFFVFVVFTAIGIFCPVVIRAAYDNDMYFLIATGKEIVENGIPTTNVWSVDRSSGFIAQQWLYDVILYGVNTFGFWGRVLFLAVELIILFFLYSHFFKLKNINSKLMFFSFVATMLFSQEYINVRPEIITIILLLVECIAIEHYIKSEKVAWLCLLPITMLLEINLHASMWPIHYAILLAYFVPAFYVKDSRKNKLYKKLLKFLPFVIIMTLVMFVNPYGVDGVGYLFQSFKAHTFEQVSIVECESATFLSAQGLCIMLNIALLFLICHFKTADSTSINITLGFTAMSAYMIRNNMFEIIVLTFIFVNLMEYVSTIKIDWKKDVVNGLIPLLVSATLFFVADALIFVNDVKDFIDTDDIVCLGTIESYISDNSEDDPRIFTGFNTGAYFEFMGHHNVYMDARPELYTKAFTGDKNILGDYVRYVVYGVSPYPIAVHELEPVGCDEMKAWLDSYNFDYIVIDTAFEVHLAGYMLNSDDYQLVEECCDSAYKLYERIDVDV